mmetsp:Transcript_27689/g.81372  ORF Transcript_27689/g.81372 Transcript_27689/m.81372 type:complete len:164 (-) Transcript_27689:82-573(-)
MALSDFLHSIEPALENGDDEDLGWAMEAMRSHVARSRCCDMKSFSRRRGSKHSDQTLAALNDQDKEDGFSTIPAANMQDQGEPMTFPVVGVEVECYEESTPQHRSKQHSSSLTQSRIIQESKSALEPTMVSSGAVTPMTEQAQNVIVSSTAWLKKEVKGYEVL